MADVCATYTYAGITINGAKDTNCLVITDDGQDGIDGLDGAPIRRQVDPLGNTDGGDSQPPHFGARIIVFRTKVHIGTVEGTGPLYQAALATYMKAVTAALEAQLNSASTLAWTESDGDARSISAVYGMPDGEVKFGPSVGNPSCTFTLLAEDPTIS
jgi:hypothetical protein